VIATATIAARRSIPSSLGADGQIALGVELLEKTRGLR
jgi:hypothetical protein